MPIKGKGRKPARDIDTESGMSRTKNTKFAKPPPPYQVDTEEEEISSATDSEEERFMEKKRKDDTRRKRSVPKPKSRRDQNVRPTDLPDEQDAEQVDEKESETPPTTSDHASFMLAMSYRTGFTPVSYPTDSTYVPDVSSLFTVLEQMTAILSENSLIHEVFPGYTSIGLYLYCAHAIFFQILRVRSDANRLTRVERRALRKYESVGPLESWMIPTPLIGFYQALGRIIPEGGKYGQIIPAFPNYAGLNDDTHHGISALSAVQGIGRLPIVPAMHTFLRNYSTGTAQPTDGIFYPVASPTLGAGPPENHFLGLTSSADTSASFNALVFSAGWKRPTETGEDTYMMVDAQKRKIIHRWAIPEVSTDFNDLEEYLSLQDGKSISWMTNLLRLAVAVTKFFPSSVSLANIPPVTRLETVSKITAGLKSGATRMTAKADTWYYRREGWNLSLQGYLLRPDAQAAYQMSLVTATRLLYSTSLLPSTPSIITSLTGSISGPYFTDATSPHIEMECTHQPDPAEQSAVIIEAKLYDNLGGRAK
jgi:hypothetical protein